MIIGMGTGRCGTVSLAEWLDVSHEHKTLIENEYLSELNGHDKAQWLIELAVQQRRHNRNRGDVSLDHINNLDYWLDQKDVTLIAVMRDREETVQSIKNYRTQRIWQKLFPQFDFQNEESIGRYWDWYYDTMIENQDKIIIISPEQIPIIRNEGKHAETKES